MKNDELEKQRRNLVNMKIISNVLSNIRQLSNAGCEKKDVIDRIGNLKLWAKKRDIDLEKVFKEKIADEMEKISILRVFDK